MKLYRVTYAEDPQLKTVIFDALKVHAWPEFMFHDPVADAHWDWLENDMAAFQFVLRDADADDRIAAVGHTVPLRWDSPLAQLPDTGWDGIFAQAHADHLAEARPNLISALEASVHPDYRGKQISARVLNEMKIIGASLGFNQLIAPVRPSQKSLYPLVPMPRYIEWRTDAGAPFDAWIRTHWRMGAQIIKIAPRSMTISASVARWEAWTQMRFPDSCDYVVPQALVPVVIDRAADSGIYVEPNVWLVHDIAPAQDLPGDKR